jgi:hypothetical protein
MTPAAPRERLIWALGMTALMALWPAASFAYVGPGLGMGAISSFFALIGAVFLGIAGFIWYPIKRLLKAFRRRPQNDPE